MSFVLLPIKCSQTLHKTTVVTHICLTWESFLGVCRQSFKNYITNSSFHKTFPEIQHSSFLSKEAKQYTFTFKSKLSFLHCLQALGLLFKFLPHPKVLNKWVNKRRKGNKILRLNGKEKKILSIQSVHQGNSGKKIS